MAQVNTALPWAAVRGLPGYGPATPLGTRPLSRGPSRTQSMVARWVVLLLLLLLLLLGSLVVCYASMH